MRTFQTQAAQGDILLIRIAALPPGVDLLPAAGLVVVAHSETGHHHVIEAPPGALELSLELSALLRHARVTSPLVLRHERTWDQHEPITIAPGLYEIRRQREWAPEGWRRVED